MFERAKASKTERAEILVEFGVSKKVLTSSGEHHEVINVIKTAFNIKEEIFLQKFDQDWQEYIDFPEGKFENKARVKVILKPNKEVPDTPATATPSSTCTISTTAGNPLRQEAQVQATLLINNGKIQVGPKAKLRQPAGTSQKLAPITAGGGVFQFEDLSRS
ncbi:hypothetical protein AWC38_SpisGene5579 [Stylophora pistillata]|uniref:Uncharacterized protein n=1 Tax=Stylophora pistillata TaxID=50429 RepID=A0A2B4SKS9_STYPI|nr:hypothetical protein AWC38_SpisGene5579 [Stylophora pistillata]